MPYYTDAERIARHYMKYGEYPDFPRKHKHWALQGLSANPSTSLLQKYRPAIMWGLLGVVALGVVVWKRRRKK